MSFKYIYILINKPFKHPQDITYVRKTLAFFLDLTNNSLQVNDVGMISSYP